MPALRDNTGKPQLSFLLDFPKAFRALTEVFQQGAIKYARDNWKLGGKPDTEYLDAALRHVFAFRSGETYASDTGNHHLAHALWNLAALIELNSGDTPTSDPEFDQEAFVAKHGKIPLYGAIKGWDGVTARQSSPEVPWHQNQPKGEPSDIRMPYLGAVVHRTKYEHWGLGVVVGIHLDKAYPYRVRWDNEPAHTHLYTADNLTVVSR